MPEFALPAEVSLFNRTDCLWSDIACLRDCLRLLKSDTRHSNAKRWSSDAEAKNRFRSGFILARGLSSHFAAATTAAEIAGPFLRVLSLLRQRRPQWPPEQGFPNTEGGRQ